MIVTVKGINFIIDDEDAHLLEKYKWYVDSKGYLCRSVNETQGKIMFHRQVMSVSDSNIFVDHIDTNPRNNSKSNLRVTNVVGNSQNRNRNKNKISSKYKGVYRKPNNMFQVFIQANGNKMALGTFNNEDVAGYVYNINAIKYFGEFALLNDVKSFTDEQIESHRCVKRSASSEYKGVNFNKTKGKYQGNFYHNKKRCFTKCFDTAKEAYDDLINMKRKLEEDSDDK
ncbi:hypothetical protein ACIGIJ_18660 [Bacillus paranthracis]|uniref:hypothetical protein n=1 Tax=Bacillus paranthracis TaxID=2026186 RepID=UPI0037CAEFB9